MKPKTNPRYANGAARRRLRARILAEEDTCWICGQHVDVHLPAGLPGSPEIDEIVPVSKGGDPLDRSNCRLAHRVCNQRRGNRTQAINPFLGYCPTTDDW